MKPIRCRACDSKITKSFIDLGEMPLANSFLSKSMFSREQNFPLHALVCQKCYLVQLEEFEIPEKIFSKYAYFSSYSNTMLQHSEKYVKEIRKKLGLSKNSFVIEIASNDGYLLQFFKKYKIPVLGIEPARNVSKHALKKGIPTITKFFGSKLAKKLAKEQLPDLLIANNVLAHVPKLNDFVEGLKILLSPSGIITLEFPHLMQLIMKNQFDTIYHEHFSYFSLTTINKLFTKHNLKIVDVQQINIHGGSLRIFVTHKENYKFKEKKSVTRLMEKEDKFGITKISTYNNFSKNILRIRKNLLKFLRDAKNKNEIVVAYGAPAKGNTLLNFAKIDSSLIEYTVDLNIHKQRLFLPGSHIPIYSPKKIFETKPNYVLILPWNLKDEIMMNMKGISKWQGKFVIPIPNMRIYR